ncbi:MAG TPA: hypothetical protein VGQ36_27345 [Thermoanaerobaculia bacterium]|nr:hypothetical protein [Thermoanaerobaculia bacterium]
MIALALALTIVVEGIIASSILRRIPWLETIAIQLTTWPIAQWLLWRTGQLWPIELGVVIVETLLWRIVLPISFRRAAVLSLAANAVTAGIAYVYSRTSM